MPTRRPRPETRCTHCNALLAKHDRKGLAIRRGALQALVTGADATVSITCYRCNTVSVVTLRSAQPPSPLKPSSD